MSQLIAGNSRLWLLTGISLSLAVLLGACGVAPSESTRSLSGVPSSVKPMSSPNLKNDPASNMSVPAINPTGQPFDNNATLAPEPLAQETETILPRPSPTARPSNAEKCTLGVGLNLNTVPILEKFRDSNGLVMTGSAELSELFFPELKGWTRVLGAPSLDDMERKARRAANNNVPFEALSYGLETGRGTPDEEWNNLVPSTQRAKDLADEYGKLLFMGPGMRLMSDNEDQYPPMAVLSDIWMIQTQRFQTNPPGPMYLQEVERIVDQIRVSNPDIVIWAQITLPPDREPEAEEWLAYHQLITDLVDGTYIGVYTWETVDNTELLGVIEEIFTTLCR